MPFQGDIDARLASVACPRRGDRVLARWSGGAYWFPGIVADIDGHLVSVQYDDGMRDTRPVHDIKAFDWRVGSRIDAIWSSNGEWYSVTITEMNGDGSALRVTFDDGIQEVKLSADCRSG